MVSKYFESIPYRLNEETGLIDYEECEKFALRSLAKAAIFSIPDMMDCQYSLRSINI